MKPFDPRIAALYRETGSVWESGRTPTDHDRTLGELVPEAWTAAFGDEIPTALPEPYDMEMGDVLYVFTGGRFLFISDFDTPTPTAELRCVMPLYFLNDPSNTRTYSCFHARNRMEALTRTAEEILPSLPLAPSSWRLYERPRPGMEPLLVLYTKGD